MRKANSRREAETRARDVLGTEELGELLAVVFGLDEKGRTKAVARVKTMQREGNDVCATERRGRGLDATYSLEDAFRIVYCFALMDAGLTPKPAVDLFKASWPGVIPAIRQAVREDEAAISVMVQGAGLGDYRRGASGVDVLIVADGQLMGAGRESHSGTSVSSFSTVRIDMSELCDRMLWLFPRLSGMFPDVARRTLLELR